MRNNGDKSSGKERQCGKTRDAGGRGSEIEVEIEGLSPFYRTGSEKPEIEGPEIEGLSPNRRSPIVGPQSSLDRHVHAACPISIKVKCHMLKP